MAAGTPATGRSMVLAAVLPLPLPGPAEPGVFA